MKKVLKTIFGFIGFVYLVVAVFAIVCLLNKNKYGYPQFGNKTLFVVLEDSKELGYEKGDLVVLVKPNNNDVIKQLDTAINNYILTDLNPIIEELRKSGNPNKLGVALVRAGRYTEAKREFQKSSSISAMNNTANILMIEKNYTAAAAQYRAVLSKDPDNAVAKKGLENANAKIE